MRRNREADILAILREYRYRGLAPTTGEIAQAAGISPNNARLVLTRLRRAGTVDSWLAHSHFDGHPRRCYTLPDPKGPA